MENAKREPKYKLGDKVKFKFDEGTWIGVITNLVWFPAGWNYEIYGFLHNEWDIIGKEE